MKQVLQNRHMGKAAVVEVPVPVLQRGRVLVRTAASLISTGTERTATEIVKKGLMAEARERPDLVRSVIEKARTEGLRNTIEKVREKLVTSQPLGYSASGTVIDVAPDVSGFRVGNRVACAGLGFASHAEILSVPKNLCVHLPATVDFTAGAFATVGAIALQGVRLANPQLGESVVVIGLGLIGQLTVQLLKANGCRVFGVDLDQSRVELAKTVGADEGCVSDEAARDVITNWSRGRGADAVIVTAATDSNQPVVLAGEISRLKGRVVIVGLIGMDIPRDIFYRRELQLHVSMSYGPGRYDPDYEERGIDYPFAYVRWTEGRNIEAFLDLIAANQIVVEPLISDRFAIGEAERAYELMSGPKPQLAMLLEYDSKIAVTRDVPLTQRQATKRQESVRIGLVGAGAYARSMLLPHFKSAGAEFVTIATASGVSAVDAGKKFQFEKAVSSADDVLTDDEVNLVVITTRHDTHAQLAARVLATHKHVFVEKPLALNESELDLVVSATMRSDALLAVGFNRRFAPLSIACKAFFSGHASPLSILYRVNAGRIDKEHWIQNADEGGGRIIGEVCHFIDLMEFLTGSVPVSVFANPINSRGAIVDADSVFITLQFADGSNGCVAYLSEGDKSLPKERIEVFGAGKSCVIDDFRTASFHDHGKTQTTTLRRQDKGQAELTRRVCELVLRGGPPLIALDELVATSRATFCAVESLRTTEPQVIQVAGF